MARDVSLVAGKRVVDALIEAGIADTNTVRVVLDIDVRGFVKAYVEKIGDVRVLDVVSSLDGTQVRYVDREETGG